MLAFKIETCVCECVGGILDYLEILCRDAGSSFADIFPVILTDNGPEFSRAGEIESSCLSDRRRCALYYCDPYQSSQKPHIEGRHTLIRRVWPKGMSLDRVNHRQVAILVSHINSYYSCARKGSPFDLSADYVPRALLGDIGIVKIEPSKVNLARNLFDQ
jgi:hypothetical protein